MPTMGRLIGAIFFGGLAWYVTTLIIPLFPEDTNLGWFQELNTLMGIFAGWSVAGPRAGTGYVASISYGLTALVAMVVLALFFNSAAVMIEQSLRKRYDGPGEAIIAVFEYFMEHGLMLLQADIITALLVGGVVGGLVVEFFGRRFT